MKTCTEKECNQKHFGKWYCNKHYTRVCKYWDAEFVKHTHWEDKINNPLYKTYNNMKSRCYNKNNHKYKNYWLRKIKVCDRRLWLNWFSNFCFDMWERPSGNYSYR